MKILLGVDASPDSKCAAQMVKYLTPPPQLYVLHVVDIWSLKHAYLDSDHSDADFEAYRQEVSKRSEHVLHETRDELSPHTQKIQLIADSGDPAESIIQTAEEVEADLIILGHRGMTAKAPFLLGGVSQKVATYAPCSVLICKESVPVLDRVLLAVDGSEASNKAVEFLATCPFKQPIQAIITTVWAPPPPSALESASGEQASSLDQSAAKDKGENLLNNLAARFETAPYETQIDWRYGDPPLGILESAKQHNVQMIVMGARGLKGIKRFFLGSVSQKVLMHGTCSVLIVR
jgi:nucleotide-binding universal stress UspA family protein